MIPDLGKYAATVLAAYGVTAMLLFGLIAISVVRSYRVGRDLEQLEKHRREQNNG